MTNAEALKDVLQQTALEEKLKPIFNNWQKHLNPLRNEILHTHPGTDELVTPRYIAKEIYEDMLYHFKKGDDYFETANSTGLRKQKVSEAIAEWLRENNLEAESKRQVNIRLPLAERETQEINSLLKEAEEEGTIRINETGTMNRYYDISIWNDEGWPKLQASLQEKGAFITNQYGERPRLTHCKTIFSPRDNEKCEKAAELCEEKDREYLQPRKKYLDRPPILATGFVSITADEELEKKLVEMGFIIDDIWHRVYVKNPLKVDSKEK